MKKKVMIIMSVLFVMICVAIMLCVHSTETNNDSVKLVVDNMQDEESTEEVQEDDLQTVKEHEDEFEVSENGVIEKKEEETIVNTATDHSAQVPVETVSEGVSSYASTEVGVPIVFLGVTEYVAEPQIVYPSSSENTTEHQPVWHDPVYEVVWVEDIPAYDAEFPIYEDHYRGVCASCGGYMYTEEEILTHPCISSWYDDWYPVLVGTGTEHIDAVGHYEQVLVQEGYWE